MVLFLLYNTSIKSVMEHNMFEWYDELRNTTSSNEKIEILKRHDSPLLRRILVAAYNPMISYGITVDPSKISEGTTGRPVSSEEVFTVLSKLANRTLTGGAAIGLIKNIRSSMESSTAVEVFDGIINRDLRCGISDSTINKAFPNLIPTFDLMACHTLDEKTETRMSWPAMLQVKYDAARVAVIVEGGKVSYRTRNGKDYGLQNADLDRVFIAMAYAYGKDVVFDGELWQADSNGKMTSRTVSNGIATKFIRGTAEPRHHAAARITLWDIVPLDDFKAGKCPILYAFRFSALENSYYTIPLTSNKPINIAQTHTVNNADEAYTLARKWMKAGLEGGILKNTSGVWEAKRSYSCLKIKAIREADLEIVAVEEGTGKNVGAMGNIICMSSDTKLRVSVGTGFSDNDRTIMWANQKQLIGKIATVQYNELISSKGRDELSLFLPRFIEIREDKNVADDLEKIKAGT